MATTGGTRLDDGFEMEQQYPPPGFNRRGVESFRPTGRPYRRGNGESLHMRPRGRPAARVRARLRVASTASPLEANPPCGLPTPLACHMSGPGQRTGGATRQSREVEQ